MDAVVPRADEPAATVIAGTDERFMNGKLLDLDHGVVSRHIFCDEEIYERGMERIIFF